MRDLIGLLDRLNRKERFFLVGQALGNPSFAPDPAFLEGVGEAAGVAFPAQADVHCFMDYHLDWLYVALVLSTGEGVGPFESPAFPSPDPDHPPLNVNANQEDIDLLLAFRAGAAIELVLIETKGATGWTVKQVASKARRLGRIFGDDGAAFDPVSPHFVLMSPKRSQALDEKIAAQGGVPSWMRPKGSLPWAPLHMPTDRIVVSRCDEGGTPAQSGVWWTMSGL